MRALESDLSQSDRPSIDDHSRHSRHSRASRFAKHWPLGVLLFVPVCVLWRALLLGEAFFYQDLSAQYIPRERLLMRSGLSGWNPHIFLGMSLAGEPQSAPYEPIRALARQLDLSDRVGLVLLFATYLGIATVGFYAFASRKGASPIGASMSVLAGLWGGVYIVRFRHPHLFTGMCAIPWAALFADLLLVEPRLIWALAFASITALGALGGGPQAPYMTWLFLGAYLAIGVWTRVPFGQRTRAFGSLGWRAFVGAIAFVGLCAIEYLPVVHLALRPTSRESSLAFAGAYSWNPWDWARLIVPDLYGNDMAQTYVGAANYHEQTVYLGLPPLLLVALACSWRRRDSSERGLLALAGGSFALAAGRFLPLFYVAYALVPGWRLFRCPARYSWFFALAAATLVGLVVTRIAAGERPPEPERTRRLLRRVWVGLSASCTLIAVGCLFARFGSADVRATVSWAACKAALLLLASGVVLDAWLRGTLRGSRACARLVALTAIDLALQWLPYRQTSPPSTFLPPATITRALAQTAPGRALVHVYRRDGLPEIVPLLNWGEAAGYDDLRGYNQFVPSDLLQLFARADGGQLANPRHYALAPIDPPDWLLDLSAVRRIAARPSDWPARWRALPRIAADGGYEVRERAGEIPRAWLVGAVERLDDTAALDRLSTIDLHRVATVETDVGLPTTSSGAPGRVRWISRRADDLAHDVEAFTPALLVLSDRYDPDWSAELDGRPEPIVRTDYLLRGVRVPVGKHRVQMHFTVRGKLVGQYVSLASAIALIGLLPVLWRRRRARAHSTIDHDLPGLHRE